MEPRVCGGLEPRADAGNLAIGANDVGFGQATSRRLASVAAEARGGIYRGASCGEDFVDCSGKTRRSESLSLCTRLYAIVRHAAASLPYGPEDGSCQESVAEAGALGDTDRHPDWLSRDQLFHQGVSQVHGTYANRISASARGLADDRQIHRSRRERANLPCLATHWFNRCGI